MATVTGTGTGSPITLSGLAQGNWKFQVAAVNGAGTSAPSASSASVAIPAGAAYTYARGVNSAGADFGNRSSSVNGTYDSDASYAFYKSRGLTMIRIPWLWEKMQPTLNGPLNATEISRLTSAVNSCTSRGMIANIDCHNYCRYQPASGGGYTMGDGNLSGANLADLWSKLAGVFKGNSLVHFGLMNEPHNLSSNSVWEQAANLTVNAIRTAGATNWCWVGGMVYSSAPAYWSQHPTWFIHDPLNRSGPEGHYYFDNPPSGTYNTGGDGSDAGVYNSAVSAAGGNLPAKTANDIKTFCSGAQSRGLRMYVGEVGWKRDGAESANWNAAGESLYKVLDQYNAFATYWAAGEAWGSGYALAVYSGKPESVVYAPATVVEGHPGAAVSP